MNDTEFHEGPTKVSPVPAGAIVVCAQCGQRLFVTLRLISAGDPIVSKDFTSIPPVPEPRQKQRLECYYCGKDFMVVKEVGDGRATRRLKWREPY